MVVLDPQKKLIEDAEGKRESLNPNLRSAIKTEGAIPAADIAKALLTQTGMEVSDLPDSLASYKHLKDNGTRTYN